jgi:hypothetical protein
MFLTGGVSLTSLNNVVYLMESLLISGLFMSIFLSVRAANAVSIEVRRKGICARGENHDRIQIVNRSRFPVFCLEVDEWHGGKPRRLAFVPPMVS